MGSTPMAPSPTDSPQADPHPGSATRTARRAQLVCERCGYPLEGLHVNQDVCPECGCDVEASDPASRPGSPWQRGPGLRSYLRTAVSLAIHPRAFWTVVQIETVRSPALAAVSLALSAGVASTSLLAPDSFGYHWSKRLIYAAGFFVAMLIVLVLLSTIEFLGLIFFARRRPGWRITPRVSLTICAHASAGWLLSGLGIAGVWLGNTWIVPLLPTRLHQFTRRSVPVEPLPFFILVAFLSGMVVYSLLAGAGFHRLRYVNDPALLSDD